MGIILFYCSNKKQKSIKDKNFLCEKYNSKFFERIHIQTKKYFITNFKY